jgi:phosphoribosylglycinamide formyltransferase-1
MRAQTTGKMKNLAIFASGEGTNAENIIRYFENSGTAKVTLLVYNRKEAGVRLRAERLGVRTEYIPKSMFGDSEKVLATLREANTDIIVLAGFLLFVPEYLLETYHNRIINIHPSLLPLHGGKGMHGIHVHEDVLACGDKETGITVHVADAQLDHGCVLFQAKCPVERGDTPEDVAARVHKLEYAYFPEVIERFCQGRYDYKLK